MHLPTFVYGLSTRLCPALPVAEYLFARQLPLAVTAAASFCQPALTPTIAEINGNSFYSPYAGAQVADLSGLVTATSSKGLWLRSTQPDDDDRTSESVFVYSNSIGSKFAVGDMISLNGHVTEYRSSSIFLYITEINYPSSMKLLSSGNPVVPVLLGAPTTGIIGDRNMSLPTEQYTCLDGGNVYAVPYNTSQLSSVNPTLKPSEYGLDFWESLSGELVTIGQPVVLDRPGNFGETWVAGNWTVTGRNARGGLTVSLGDGNPETILVGNPLDGTHNPRTPKMGDSLADITGVIYYQYGFYYILPTTAISVEASPEPAMPPATAITGTSCASLTFGDYNVENLDANSTHLPLIANHIANYLNGPALMFLQEIQDNSGPDDDGTVDANMTLTALTSAIAAAGGPVYNFTDINPLNDKSGGQPGGNIRNAYLYDPLRVQLAFINPGNSTQANSVTSTPDGPKLTYNPGLIEPASPAFGDSRKPLAAQWKPTDSNSTFFTVVVHFTSKGGSTSLQGDPRTPVNHGADVREMQGNVTGRFISSILTLDPRASIITAGDFNEFAFIQPVTTFSKISGLVDINDAAKVPSQERYTYLFGPSAQEIDQVFVSPALAAKKLDVEHVHVNTWADRANEVSDHDPSVFVLDVC